MADLDSASLTVWKLLALDDAELEQFDFVAANLAIARQIPALVKLDISRFVTIVDDWTQRFARQLPDMERIFKQTPARWMRDVRFFRVGMLEGFLGHEIDLRRIEEQKHAMAISCTDPSDPFVNALIDKAARHAAKCRRMGWPMSRVIAEFQLLSRFDDGHVIHGVEAPTNHPGAGPASHAACQHFMGTGQVDAVNTVYPLSQTLFPRYCNSSRERKIP